MKKCLQCGQEAEDSLNFCGHCGASLGQEPAERSDGGRTADAEGKKEKRGKGPQQRRKDAGKDGRILSFKGLLCTAFMAACFGFPGITTAETWSVQNEFMVCVRLAAYTGAVVLAVLAVLSAYNRRKLLVIAGLIFGGVYLLGRLHIGGAGAKMIHVISMADAVLCVVAGIIPAFIVYLILKLVSGRVADAVVYQVVRWILIVVAGFIFGYLLFRLLPGRRSDRKIWEWMERCLEVVSR